MHAFIWDTRAEIDSALGCVCGSVEAPLSTRQGGKMLRTGVGQEGPECCTVKFNIVGTIERDSEDERIAW